jgi:predicted nucleic acid-binding protein
LAFDAHAVGRCRYQPAQLPGADRRDPRSACPFEKVLMPDAVRAELRHDSAPDAVRIWGANLPDWIEVRAAPSATESSFGVLDEGERAALELALAVRADLVLMDDRTGVAAARQRGFAVIGTLGVLDLAARHGLTDLAEALSRLKATNFRYRPEFMDALLAEHRARNLGS